MNEILYFKVEKLVARSCWLLDQKEYDAWTDLFADDGVYSIHAYSPEIQKNMVWMHHNKAELMQILSELPKHITDSDAKRRHLISVIDIKFQDEGTADVISNFAVCRTDINGITNIYAVGQYHDLCILQHNRWVMKERKVLLDTRQFEAASQYPI